jgi:predicted HicB family RNase H-like nuclease
MMKYKGYTGVIEIDEEAGILFGDVIGLRDVITFQGDTVEEAQTSFRESIDFYLELCAKQGKPPEKPFSGKFMVRISPELHRAVVIEAMTRKISLNSLIDLTLSEAFLTPAASAKSDTATSDLKKEARKAAFDTLVTRAKASARKRAKQPETEDAKSPTRRTKAG